MKKAEIIDKSKLYELIEFILSDSNAIICESYSEMEEEIKYLNDFSLFKDYFENSISENKKHLAFGIHYQDNKGKISITKIKLDPKHCKGKTYRYRIDGWGLIYIHLNLTNSNIIECKVSSNSQKRAKNWETTNPEFGSTELWDWKMIESKTRKIINHLKKISIKSD